jgi:hypothetical protein
MLRLFAARSRTTLMLVTRLRLTAAAAMIALSAGPAFGHVAAEAAFAGIALGVIPSPSAGRTDFITVDGRAGSPLVVEGGVPLYKALAVGVEWRTLGTVHVVDRSGPTVFTSEMETERLLMFGARVYRSGNTQVVTSQVTTSGAAPLVAFGADVPVSAAAHVQVVGAFRTIRVVRAVPSTFTADGWHAAFQVGIRVTW